MRLGGREAQEAKDLIAFANRFQKRVTLGGTCVRAAIALSYFGINKMQFINLSIFVSLISKHLSEYSGKYKSSSFLVFLNKHSNSR